MRPVVLIMCAVVAAGVFAAVLGSIWGTRYRKEEQPHASQQSVALELVWAAIPCLMVLAAAVPAVMALLSAHALH